MPNRKVRKVQKHILIFKSDNEWFKKYMKEREADSIAEIIHMLITNYQTNQNQQDVINLLNKIAKKQTDMSIEQSTIAEYMSDYLYAEKYHGEAVHVHYGTDTPGYKNAKKLALKHIKKAQENHSKKVNHEEAVRNRNERIGNIRFR